MTEQLTVLPRLNADDVFERICAILLPDQPPDEDEFEPPGATSDMIACYYNFLAPRLLVGIRLTGREDMGYFGWEERFIWGAGDPDEYRKLQKEYGSSRDKYLFIKLDEHNEDVGILARVKRISDKKFFTIPLEDLDIGLWTKTNAPSYQFQTTPTLRQAFPGG